MQCARSQLCESTVLVQNKQKAYYIAFFIYCVAYWLSFTAFAPGIFATFAYLISLALLVIKMSAERYTKHQLITLIVVGIVVYLSWFFSDDKALVMLFGFVAAGRDIDLSRLARTALLSVGLVLAITVAGCLSGYIESVSVTRADGFVRESLGFTHPNRLGSALLSLVVSSAVIIKKGDGWLLAALLVPAIGISVLVCDSRSAVLGAILCFIIFELAYYSENNKTKTRILLRIASYLVVAVIILSIAAMLIYDTNNHIMILINKLFSGRWELSNFAFREYPPKPFGQSFENAGVFLNSFQEVIVDNAYARAELVYGWIPGTLVLIAIMYTWHGISKSDCVPAWFLPGFVYAMYGISESQALHFAVNFGLIGLVPVLYGGTNGSKDSLLSTEQIVNKLRNKVYNLIMSIIRNPTYKIRMRQVNRFIMSGEEANSKASNITVSLTSFGSRVESVHLAIASIMDQTIPPSRVVLYLDEETCPKELPVELKSLCSRGLIIRRGIENLRGHKKYFYAMQEYPKSIIVTIDDDILYPRNTLKQLIKWSSKYQNAIIARRTHEVVYDLDGNIMPYTQWVYEYRGLRHITNRFFFTGNGGVLYPAGCLSKNTFNINAIRECSLSADDVWLNCSARSLNVPIVRASTGLIPYWEIAGTQDEALNRGNVAGGGNDIAIKKTMKIFCLAQDVFLDRRSHI